MKLRLEAGSKGIVQIHAIFALVSALVLLIPGPAPGWKLLGLAGFYNVLLPVAAFKRSNPEWLSIWLFTFPASVMMIMPDWFLSAQLGILVFPVDGSPMIGTVPVYMAGLWTIPLFAITYTGLRLFDKYGHLRAVGAVALLSLVVFGLAEETMWMIGSWYPQNVTLISHTAVYVLLPEVILGVSAYVLYFLTRHAHILRRLFWAYVVMVVYLGNLCLSYFVLERILLS
ncbi:MAG: hypothetical protein QXS20_03705 [Candidatus Thorarchaeota archaeon]